MIGEPPELALQAAEHPAIFLGPSLSRREAIRQLPGATWHRPVRRGDLPAVVASGVKRLGIIDGEFGQSLAVSVSEIREALRRGVTVFGAASMGALRAAECWRLGMRGIGWTFRGYHDGTLTADDEVALLFDPHGGQAVTIPLVNFRWTVELGILHKIIPPDAAPRLIEAARAVHFTERVTDAVMAMARQRGCIKDMQAIVAFMQSEPARCDRKALDAIELLHEMAGGTLL